MYVIFNADMRCSYGGELMLSQKKHRNRMPGDEATQNSYIPYSLR